MERKGSLTPGGGLLKKEPKFLPDRQANDPSRQKKTIVVVFVINGDIVNYDLYNMTS